MHWELLFFAPFACVMSIALAQLAKSIWRFSVWKRRQALLARIEKRVKP